MTDAQRAAMYRTRRHELAMSAHEDLKRASTAMLLEALALQLKAVSDTNHSDKARDIAGQLIYELCERHAIRLSQGDEIDSIKSRIVCGNKTLDP